MGKWTDASNSRSGTGASCFQPSFAFFSLFSVSPTAGIFQHKMTTQFDRIYHGLSNEVGSMFNFNSTPKTRCVY